MQAAVCFSAVFCFCCAKVALCRLLCRLSKMLLPSKQFASYGLCLFEIFPRFHYSLLTTSFVVAHRLCSLRQKLGDALHRHVCNHIHSRLNFSLLCKSRPRLPLMSASTLSRSVKQFLSTSLRPVCTWTTALRAPFSQNRAACSPCLRHSKVVNGLPSGQVAFPSLDPEAQTRHGSSRR